ncbi:MAG TPA: hypothetical protein VJP87_02155 [Candidatus Acidoferrales bacterium]|nr:hypothetical protein [Candidatus Acidoferrales bacterium]
MIDPDDGDEEIAYDVADRRRPRGPSAEKDASSGAFSSSTMMVTITAKTASEKAASRSALIFSCCT